MRKGTLVTFNLKDADPADFAESSEGKERVEELDGHFAIITSVAVRPKDGNKDWGYYNIEFGNGNVLIAVSGIHLTPHKK